MAVFETLLSLLFMSYCRNSYRLKFTKENLVVKSVKQFSLIVCVLLFLYFSPVKIKNFSFE